VTEPSADREPQTAWQLLKPDFGWLGHLVSWKAIIAAFVIAGIVFALFVVTGGVNIAADEPDSFVARHFLHFVFKSSVGSRARGLIAPDDLAAPTRVRLGAQHFDMVCANCHGRPGFGQSVVALSMSPRPQDLPKVLDQFTDQELYLIVEHGVKYSAMPSWPTAQRSDEVWSMVAFLRQLPKLDAKTYLEMTALPEKGSTAPTGTGDDTALRPANSQRNAPPTDEPAARADAWASLLVEVADSSLNFDTNEKRLLYARAGIREYWVVDINGRRLLTYRDPQGGDYATHQALGPSDTVVPLAAPAAAVRVADLLV